MYCRLVPQYHITSRGHMRETFPPERQVEVTRHSGNVYSFHLLDIELQPYAETVQAVAHLAIATSEKNKNMREELANDTFLMLYTPKLRQLDKKIAVPAHFSPLIFLDRYQKPSLMNKAIYYSAMLVS